MAAAPTGLGHTDNSVSVVLTPVSMQDMIISESLSDLSDVDSGAKGDKNNRGEDMSRVAGGVLREVQDVTSTEKIISEDLPACRIKLYVHNTDGSRIFVSFLMLLLECVLYQLI